jgi:hypothetical protein
MTWKKGPGLLGLKLCFSPFPIQDNLALYIDQYIIYLHIVKTFIFKVFNYLMLKTFGSFYRRCEQYYQI